jgi:hypothetical protein
MAGAQQGAIRIAPSDISAQEHRLKNETGRKLIAARVRGNPTEMLAPQCSNGNFESGTLAGYDGKDGFTTFTTKNFSYPNLGISSATGDIDDRDAHQTIVSASIDKYAPISTVAPGGSTKAVRIGNAATSHNSQAKGEILSKTFVVTQTTMNFKYALVMENPTVYHAPVDSPAFIVRVRNASGVDITSLTLGNAARQPRVFLSATSNEVVANVGNPFFKSDGRKGPSNDILLWKDWTCNTIDLSDLIGQTVTIEWETHDCTVSAGGGHAAWAYIDDICSTDCASNEGAVTLNQAASSKCGAGKLCFDFTVPRAGIAPPSTGTTQLSLQLYQNGVAVGAPLTSPVQTANGQYCFSMLPTVTPALNTSQPGFDWVVTSTNKIGAVILAPKFVGTVPDGLLSGKNNDYAFACTPSPSSSSDTCCPPLNKLQTQSFFVEPDNLLGQPYTTQFMNVVLNPSSPAQVSANTAITNWYQAMNAYEGLLKFTCGATKLVATFEKFLGDNQSPPVPQGPALASFTATFTGGTGAALSAGLSGFNNYSHAINTMYITTVTIRAYNAQGVEVTCFDVNTCKQTDRYSYLHYFGGAGGRMAGRPSMISRPSGLMIGE